MPFTLEHRIQLLRMRMFRNRQKFDELTKLGETAKCRACIYRDRQLHKLLAKLENERHVPH